MENIWHLEKDNKRITSSRRRLGANPRRERSPGASHANAETPRIRHANPDARIPRILGNPAMREQKALRGAEECERMREMKRILVTHPLRPGG
jgi:hypothetical protein